MKKILAVVIVYYPDPELLRRNIAAFSDGVDHLLIWRNSPLEGDFGDAELLGDGSNRGIAQALNAAWRIAREKNYDFLLTMDQDSLWSDFAAYRSLALSGNVPEGLWGPGINDEEITEDWVPSDTLITSGMLIPLPVLEAIGGWNPDLIVDGLDVDLVYHAAALGIPSYKLGAGRLTQRFGHRRRARFAGLSFWVYDYPPERLYSIFCSHLRVIRSYPSVTGPLRKRFVRRWFLSRIPRILLGERNRLAKMNAIRLGIRDGLRAATV